MRGIVCVAASRSGVAMGSWGGGGALTEMQRSKKATKESCVAASASVADIRSLVTVRVGARLNLWTNGTVCNLWAGDRA